MWHEWYGCILCRMYWNLGYNVFRLTGLGQNILVWDTKGIYEEKPIIWNLPTCDPFCRKCHEWV